MGWNSRLHLVASDGIMIWADEGLSSSNFLVRNYGPAPWAVRCIRNLGVNLSSVTSDPADDPVDPAYEFVKGTGNKETAGILRIKHYYGTVLRDYTSSSIPVHKVPSDYNKLGLYGFEVALRGNGGNNQTTYVAQSSEATEAASTATAFQNAVNTASPCSRLEGLTGRRGWRIPNQKELVIMQRAGILSFSSGSFYWGCTQENWTAGNNTGTANSTSTNFSDYRFCTVRSDGNSTAQPFGDLRLVRCVRDLTPEEAGFTTYEQVAAYTNAN